MKFDYDIIVVGAGHAGCEAAAAAARLGASTLLITMDMNKIAQMSCNPAIGGIAKGQIVREIDALGGFTGIVTDRTAVQSRMLNRSKGPAMWSPRAQSDRMRFSALWREILENTPNLYIWQDTVNELLIEPFADETLDENNSQNAESDKIQQRVVGVRTCGGATFHSKATVLTVGTFLNGLMHVGRTMNPGGRIAEPVSRGITEQLIGLGFTAGRMKTGTPVRIDGRSVHWELTQEQNGDPSHVGFSFMPGNYSALKQRPCHIVHTNEKTHEILREGLPDSPLYNGQIQSIGPRYCPSIETKIVTFADKDSHQLFLEPEGETTQEYYVNGFSSSLPLDIQVKALETVPALADVQIYRPGYAIEYDYFDPTQLKHTLETKRIENLYFAGQINGTTGYEEAAGQGLVAGANAALKQQGRGRLTIGRDQGYIGVLIDDLVTKGVDEPYRMFTSRAEYRILLRQDNADQRLTPMGYELGLVEDRRMAIFSKKQDWIQRLIDFAENYTVRAEDINKFLVEHDSAPLKHNQRLADLITRPQVRLSEIVEILPEVKSQFDDIDFGEYTNQMREIILDSVEIQIKYRGYIEREQQNADKLRRLEDIIIKNKFDYNTIKALSTEARQKLVKIQPETIGQASRIPGVSPSDINILLMLCGR